MFKLPSFPFINLCSLICKIKANYFISDKDKFVPFYMLNKLYDACKAPKDKLIVKEAGHAKSEKIATDIYWDKVINFINKYIK